MLRTIARAVTILLLLLFFGGSHAADFVAYPGATLDRPMSAKSTKVAKDTGTADEVSVFTTRDPFDRVTAFYARIGVEYEAAWARIVRKLPDGREIKIKVFVLDGKPDLSDSRRWVQVQYPFIGDVEMDGTTPRYRDVRDVTSIVYTFMK
ncbi:MAG: hypothetical protein HW419_3139 [Deltaproteobacteria bacterium]|nr:hypothetical protein [Deltaproteobacteria bacterium]